MLTQQCLRDGVRKLLSPEDWEKCFRKGHLIQNITSTLNSGVVFWLVCFLVCLLRSSEIAKVDIYDFCGSEGAKKNL